MSRNHTTITAIVALCGIVWCGVAPVVYAEARNASGNGSMVSVGPGILAPTFPVVPEQKRIDVPRFALDRTAVTNEAYLAFVRAHPKWQKGHVSRLFADERYLQHWAGPLTLGANAGPRQPVTNVSWFAARAYCETQGARLPKWSEWEFVAVASETAADARDDAAWQQRILGWYAAPDRGALRTVGQGKPNFYGVHDLHGLVWEWVEDFGSLLVAGDSRESGGADRKFCGAGALSAQEKRSYAMFMRVAYLSALEGNYTTTKLGFRCAKAQTKDSP